MIPQLLNNSFVRSFIVIVLICLRIILGRLSMVGSVEEKFYLQSQVDIVYTDFLLNEKKYNFTRDIFIILNSFKDKIT